MAPFKPAYLETHNRGLLKEKIDQAYEILKACTLCPRACGVDRLSDEKGICQTGEHAIVSSFNAHFGEESPLVGNHGSGTIFFARCNLLCIFCQNYDISHEGQGVEFSSEQLARAMLFLQDRGCHNINFVTPTHVVPQILAALDKAIEGGLRVPLVYNTGGYDRSETLAILDGVFDIYMPDFKYWDPKVAEELSDAPDYPEVAREALKEMHRQVGDLVMDEQGIAQRGVLIRHLVLPEGLAGTRQVMRFLAREISPNSYVNIMAQYRPCGRASEVPALRRSITDEEYQEAIQMAHDEGINRLDERKRVFLFHWM
ncbi:MAG: radical SAM protein [Deltaproteobacteria bacterium]|nr:radical SAM protein [Deltaproteobacteria bacterium]MBW1793806.1 radical SAM protein [Deltaproteobacteria bacterium]MBW2329701.1 radical SAM protein [Deltaproteobacteria bacterium]